MHQWVEERHEKTEGERTTVWYTYETKWMPRHVSSAGFNDAGHDNPSSMPFESQAFWPQETTLGGY